MIFFWFNLSISFGSLALKCYNQIEWQRRWGSPPKLQPPMVASHVESQSSLSQMMRWIWSPRIRQSSYGPHTQTGWWRIHLVSMTWGMHSTTITTILVFAAIIGPRNKYKPLYCIYIIKYFHWIYSSFELEFSFWNHLNSVCICAYTKCLTRNEAK